MNPGVYVWLKNKEGRVIGFSSRVFDTDLLSRGQELEVELAVIPAFGNSTEYETYEVRAFGELFK